MSRFEINANGRQIIVDHDGTDLVYVIEKALQAWRDTEPPAAKHPAGFGPPTATGGSGTSPPSG